MIVVSGCPRSGTSLTMDLLRTVLGEQRLLGKKFPQEHRIMQELSARPNESLIEFENRKWLFEYNNEDWRKDLAESKDMNPNGFWECFCSVQGIQFDYQNAALLKSIIKAKKENTPPRIVKIVSQGLLQSDPQYLSKIVYLIRHPRAVAKSQERLKQNTPRHLPKHIQKTIKDNQEVKHSPEMYINVTIAAARFFLENPEIPTHFVEYASLIESPKETMEGIKTFIDEEGDWDAAIERINPKLRRSYPKEVDHTLWAAADTIYDLSLKQDWQGILDYAARADTVLREVDDHKKNKKEQVHKCPRLDREVVASECKLCKKDPVVVANFKKAANEMNIHWGELPCFYDCYIQKDPISVEESIEKNHWILEG